LGPPSTPSLGTDPWYLDSGTSFHMTPHSTHLFALRPSYRHYIVHTVDDFPLSVVGHDTLCSDSFYVLDISLVPDLTMQLMSAGQIIDHDCCVILDPIFAIFRIVTRVIWLVLPPGAMTHIFFGSLTGFVFLLLHPPVLPVLLSLLHACHHFINGIIIWVIFVDVDYLLCIVDVF
jgi:hypothetical protein